jgi:hypothetical protein
MEPPGFWFSSFRNSEQGPLSSLCSWMSGVWPISSVTEVWQEMNQQITNYIRGKVLYYSTSPF